MKNKNILALCVAVPLFIACTPAKQTGKDFQWGELPQQPDLSWVDSVGSRQEPINHITLSANSLGAVADSVQQLYKKQSTVVPSPAGEPSLSNRDITRQGHSLSKAE
jgi:hypothetical protein